MWPRVPSAVGTGARIADSVSKVDTTTELDALTFYRGPHPTWIVDGGVER